MAHGDHAITRPCAHSAENFGADQGVKASFVDRASRLFVISVDGKLDAQDTLAHDFLEHVELVEHHHKCAERNGGEDGEQVEPCAYRHPYCHRHEDEPDVPRLLHCVAEPDYGKRAHQGKGSGDVGADDQHYDRYDATHDHQGMHIGLGVGHALVSVAVDVAHEHRECEAQEQYYGDVHERECSCQVPELLQISY